MRWSGPAVVVLIALLIAPAAGVGADAAARPNPCVGTITSPANGLTVISVQGARVKGPDRGKRRARLVGVGPRGEIRWVHSSGPERGIVWSYDVDPLPDGDLFVTATRPDRTVFYEFDPRTLTVEWETVLPFTDTHDADLLGEHRILIAHMRNYDETTGRNDDRILIYNRTSGEVAWEWLFREHGFSRSGGGNYSHDWTHVNDIDRIAPGEYLVSVRNFDQVIVVNRSTGDVDLRLGADGTHRIMREQHNPMYLESESGRPTILVADSGNDRVVEYERRGGGWERTWSVGNSEVFSWPRDADRLPNGNTLIVDSINHRVVEVTPDGEVVWEFYAPWLVYDVERVRYGDEAGGPTMRDVGAPSNPSLDAAPRPASALEECARTLRTFENPEVIATPSPGNGTPTKTDDNGTVTEPSDDGATSRDTLVALVVLLALLALAGWAAYSE